MIEKKLIVEVDPVVDCLECIQDRTEDDIIIQTIDEVIDIIYHFAKGENK